MVQSKLVLKSIASFPFGVGDVGAEMVDAVVADAVVGGFVRFVSDHHGRWRAIELDDDQMPTLHLDDALWRAVLTPDFLPFAVPRAQHEPVDIETIKRPLSTPTG